MSVPGDERVIGKDFVKPTLVGGVMVFGPHTVRQRLIISGIRKVLGKEVTDTSWVDIEVIS